MALYRSIQMTFWTDTKISDDFTPEDKYFYLYLFTNPHTNLCGCYEISIKQIANDTGYSKDTVERLIDRFVNVHNVIGYNRETKEILILNWHKYNWTNSPKFKKPLEKEIAAVKTESFKNYLVDLVNGKETTYGMHTYCMDTTCMHTTVTNTNTDTDFFADADIDELWKTIRDRYPRNEGKGKVSHDKFVDTFMGIPKNRYRYHANVIARAITLYSNDQKEKYGSYDYCKAFDNWFDMEFEYWYSVAEKKYRKNIEEGIKKEREMENVKDEIKESDAKSKETGNEHS